MLYFDVSLLRVGFDYLRHCARVYIISVCVVRQQILTGGYPEDDYYYCFILAARNVAKLMQTIFRYLN